MKTTYLLAAPLILLVSCSSIKPQAPDLPASQLVSKPLPASNIDVPVSVDVVQVIADLNTRVPMEFKGEGPAGPGQYRWKLDRQPFNSFFSADSLRVSDTAHLEVGGYLKNPLNGHWQNISSCNADLHMGIGVNFQLANDYSLSANPKLTQFDIKGCGLKIANLDITSMVKPGIAETIGNDIKNSDKQAGGINYRSLLQPAWSALDQPVKVGDFGFLVIDPTAVRAGNVSISGKLLNFSAGITAKPVFYLNDPGKRQEAALPDISDATGNGFNLNLDIHLDYKPLNKLVNDAIADKKITVSAKSYIIINEADIYGSGNEHLLIKVKFTGKQGVIPYHGLLYFTCLPVYEPSTGDVYIKDIDFDVHTISALQQGPAAWLLNAAIKKYMNDQVHFNIARQIKNLKSKLNEALNKPAGKNVMLAGKINSVDPAGILPLKDYILLRVSATGNLLVNLK